MSELMSTSNNTPSAGKTGEKIPLRERIARALYDSNRRQFIAFAFSEWDETDKEIQSFFHNDAQAIIEELGLEEETETVENSTIASPTMASSRYRHVTPWSKWSEQ